MPRSDVETDNERTARESYATVKKIAARRGLTFDEAAERDPAARRILELVNEMADLLGGDPAPVEKAAPGYLEVAAREIASKDGILVESAYGRISKHYPDLAERYRLENS
jgi:hypothetical protein